MSLCITPEFRPHGIFVRAVIWRRVSEIGCAISRSTQKWPNNALDPSAVSVLDYMRFDFTEVFSYRDRAVPAVGHIGSFGDNSTPLCMKEPIEFTNREQFLLSYYREPPLSSWSRHVILDGIYVVLSFFFVWLYMTGDDVGWGCVGYGILIWRVVWGVWQSRRYTKDLRSILTKYDAKVRELADRIEQKDRTP